MLDDGQLASEFQTKLAVKQGLWSESNVHGGWVRRLRDAGARVWRTFGNSALTQLSAVRRGVRRTAGKTGNHLCPYGAS